MKTPATERIKSSLMRDSAMRIFLALSLLALVLLSACAPKAEQAPAGSEAAPASVEQLGTQNEEISSIETDLGTGGLDGIESGLTEIETG